MKHLPLKRLFRVVGGSTPSGDAENWGGDVCWVTPEDMSALNGREIVGSRRTLTDQGYLSCGTRMVPEDSVIVTSRAPIGNVGVAARSLCTNQGCKALVPRAGVCSSYYYFVLVSLVEAMQALGRGSTFTEISGDRLGAMTVPVPALPEQRAIADFLDQKTAAIDALIAKKERLLALLDEKRQALITQAVTKGLDPSVPMKESGLPAIGAVPRHWFVGALKRRWTVLDCKHRTVPFVDDGYPVASIGEVHGFEVDLAGANRTTPDEWGVMCGGGRRPQVGDVIYSRNATVGEAAFVARDEPFCMGQDVSLIRSTRENQRYLVHLLRSPAVLRQLDVVMIGSTFKRINVGAIKELVVCAPPRTEQDLIAAECDRVMRRGEHLAQAVLKHIALLREYRQALITAAVTGQLDVRSKQARAMDPAA